MKTKICSLIIILAAVLCGCIFDSGNGHHTPKPPEPPVIPFTGEQFNAAGATDVDANGEYIALYDADTKQFVHWENGSGYFVQTNSVNGHLQWLNPNGDVTLYSSLAPSGICAAKWQTVDGIGNAPTTKCTK